MFANQFTMPKIVGSATPCEALKRRVYEQDEIEATGCVGQLPAPLAKRHVEMRRPVAVNRAKTHLACLAGGVRM